MAKALEQIASLLAQIEKLKQGAAKELTTEATGVINDVAGLLERYAKLDAKEQVKADLIEPLRELFKEHGFGGGTAAKASSGEGKPRRERQTRTPEEMKAAKDRDEKRRKEALAYLKKNPSSTGSQLNAAVGKLETVPGGSWKQALGDLVKTKGEKRNMTYSLAD